MLNGKYNVHKRTSTFRLLSVDLNQGTVVYTVPLGYPGGGAHAGSSSKNTWCNQQGSKHADSGLKHRHSTPADRD